MQKSSDLGYTTLNFLDTLPYLLLTPSVPRGTIRTPVLSNTIHNEASSVASKNRNTFVVGMLNLDEDQQVHFTKFLARLFARQRLHVVPPASAAAPPMPPPDSDRSIGRNKPASASPQPKEPPR